MMIADSSKLAKKLTLRLGKVALAAVQSRHPPRDPSPVFQEKIYHLLLVRKAKETFGTKENRLDV